MFWIKFFYSTKWRKKWAMVGGLFSIDQNWFGIVNDSFFYYSFQNVGYAFGTRGIDLTEIQIRMVKLRSTVFAFLKIESSQIHTCVKCGDDPRNPKCDMILSPANSDRRSRFSVSIINSVGFLLGNFPHLQLFDFKCKMFGTKILFDHFYSLVQERFWVDQSMQRLWVEHVWIENWNTPKRSAIVFLLCSLTIRISITWTNWLLWLHWRTAFSLINVTNPFFKILFYLNKQL